MAQSFFSQSPLNYAYNSLFGQKVPQNYYTNYLPNQDYYAKQQYDISGNMMPNNAKASIGPIQPVYQPNAYKAPTVAPKANTTTKKTTTTVAPQTSAKTGYYRSPDGTIKKYGSPSNVQEEVEIPDQVSEEQRMIEEMYAPTMDWLSSQRENLGNQFNQSRDFYQSSFNPQYEQLAAAKASAQALNAQNQQGVQKQTQGAIDLANKTYQELSQRNQQMYGGMSSVGQFGSEIQGRELQGNVAQATNTGAENMATLKNQLVDIESNYNTQKQAIDQQKTQTLLELQQGFENQMSEIDRQKASISGSKATDKLNALREFNANRQAIEDQSRSLLQQLGTNALAAQQQIQSSIAQYQAQAGATPDLNAIPGMQYSQYLPTVGPEGEVVNPLLSLKRRQELGLV